MCTESIVLHLFSMTNANVALCSNGLSPSLCLFGFSLSPCLPSSLALSLWFTNSVSKAFSDAANETFYTTKPTIEPGRHGGNHSSHLISKAAAPDRQNKEKQIITEMINKGLRTASNGATGDEPNEL